MKRLLTVEDLHVSFYTHAGEVQAVRGAGFYVDEGETVAVVGESGCGKSVTSKAIMGLLPPKQSVIKSGRIDFQGRNLLELPVKEMRKLCGKDCAMIFQDALSALNPTLSVGTQVTENLKNHSPMGKRERYRAAVQVLNRVGIADADACMKKYPLELSGGIRQRVMIASAVICNPVLLIADEPTTALDVTIQAQVLELLGEIQKDMKTAILLITHDLGVVARMADRVIVMYAGEVVEQGECDTIFYRPKHPYTKALLQSVPQIKREKEELLSIKGSLPSALHLPKGCIFAQRCEKCMNICQKESPGVFHVEDEHEVSCWLIEKENFKKNMCEKGRSV